MGLQGFNLFFQGLFQGFDAFQAVIQVCSAVQYLQPDIILPGQDRFKFTVCGPDLGGDTSVYIERNPAGNAVAYLVVTKKLRLQVHRIGNGIDQPAFIVVAVCCHGVNFTPVAASRLPGRCLLHGCPVMGRLEGRGVFLHLLQNIAQPLRLGRCYTAEHDGDGYHDISKPW